MARDCVTHHHACDCREARFREIEAALASAVECEGELMDAVRRLEAERDALKRECEALREALSDVRDSLDDELGDTDPTFPDYFTDHDVRCEDPIFWCHKRITKALSAALSPAEPMLTEGNESDVLSISEPPLYGPCEHGQDYPSNCSQCYPNRSAAEPKENGE